MSDPSPPVAAVPVVIGVAAAGASPPVAAAVVAQPNQVGFGSFLRNAFRSPGSRKSAVAVAADRREKEKVVIAGGVGMNKETEADRVKRMQALRKEMEQIAARRLNDHQDEEEDENHYRAYNSDLGEDEQDFALIRRREKERNERNHGNGKKPVASGVQGDFWRCSQCTVANENILVQCLVCNAARPSPAQGGPKVVSFICEVCTYVNADGSAIQCEMCGTKRTVPPGGSGGSGAGNAADGESKEDHGANGGAFVMGEGAPPPLKRQLLIREHLAFLAGVEEAFGTIHIAPILLQGIERLVRKPFDALMTQYGPAASPLHHPPGAAASVITPDILATLLKALVYRSCLAAMRVQSTMDLILGCCILEEEELRLLTCNLCGENGGEVALHYSDTCGPGIRHTICLPCTHTYVARLVESKQCAKILCPFMMKANESESGGVPGGPNGGGGGGGLIRCDKEVDVKWVRRCLSVRDFQNYLDECFQIMIAGPGAAGSSAPGALGLQPSAGASSYLHCPNAACKSIMEVMRPHGLVVPILIKEVDEAGKVLSPAAWLHYSEFRVRCHSCHTNFCSDCKTIPYHTGRNCQEHQGYLVAKHCRFCAESMTPENSDASNQIRAYDNICTSDTCLERREFACTEMLACGHPCPGIKGESEHMSCLLEECAALDPSLKVCSADLCSICWVEELGLAPVVKLTSCGHIFHRHCVVDKMAKKWPGVRITFGFMDCSVCKIPMDHTCPSIRQVKAPIDHLFGQIKTKALARLTIEKMEQDPKLIEPTSRYYGQPLKYAIDCFAYYNCFKCKEFYFGGRRDCEQNAAAENRPEEEFVCYGCADLKSVQCKNAEHSEYLVWKCRFCCNLASWFCFGTTHYCEPCHKDNPMEKVRRARSGFKQCAGYQMCPTKSVHAPNGSEAECEHCLGCGACQEELTKLQAAKEKDKLVEEKSKEMAHASVQL